MANEEKSYGWLGVDMPMQVKIRMALIQRAIDPEDLYTDKSGFGLDKNPHVTVAYGHEENDPESTRQAIDDIGAGEGRLGGLSQFKNKDYNVLKFDVNSDHLRTLNKRVRERIAMPGQTFKDYNPHVTVAYLKPGVDVEKYRKLEKLLKTRRFPVKMIRFSNPKNEYRTLLLKEVLKKSAEETIKEGNASGQVMNMNPTEAQIEAENYKKAHVDIDGLKISIENPVGSTRSGTDKGGKEWTQDIWDDYGYIKGSMGYDKDHVDVFLHADLSGKPDTVYIINQLNKENSFDEHKCMIGYASKASARASYLQNYEDGWDRDGTIIEMAWDDFKKWSKSDLPAKGECTEEYLEKIAKIVLDIDVGDTVLVGRFKNKPIVVKDVGTDSNGQPTINGRKLLSLRIKKLMPKKKKAASVSSASKKLRKGKGTAKAAGRMRKNAESTHTTTTGGDTYDVEALIELVKIRESRKIDIKDLPKPNRSRNTGFQQGRYEDSKLKYPLLYNEKTDEVIDGRHRLAKAIDKGRKTLRYIPVSSKDMESVKISKKASDESLSILDKAISRAEGIPKEAGAGKAGLIGAGIGATIGGVGGYMLSGEEDKEEAALAGAVLGGATGAVTGIAGAALLAKLRRGEPVKNRDSFNIPKKRGLLDVKQAYKNIYGDRLDEEASQADEAARKIGAPWSNKEKLERLLRYKEDSALNARILMYDYDEAGVEPPNGRADPQTIYLPHEDAEKRRQYSESDLKRASQIQEFWGDSTQVESGIKADEYMEMLEGDNANETMMHEVNHFVTAGDHPTKSKEFTDKAMTDEGIDVGEDLWDITYPEYRSLEVTPPLSAMQHWWFKRTGDRIENDSDYEEAINILESTDDAALPSEVRRLKRYRQHMDKRGKLENYDNVNKRLLPTIVKNKVIDFLMGNPKGKDLTEPSELTPEDREAAEGAMSQLLMGDNVKKVAKEVEHINTSLDVLNRALSRVEGK